MALLALEIPSFETFGRQALRSGSLAQRHDERGENRLRAMIWMLRSGRDATAVGRTVDLIVVFGGGLGDGNRDVIGDHRRLDLIDLALGGLMIALRVGGQMISFNEIQSTLLAFVPFRDGVLGQMRHVIGRVAKFFVLARRFDGEAFKTIRTHSLLHVVVEC